MNLQQPVESGQFLKRYKRFFADLNYKNKTIVAHVPNTGSLKTCLNEKAECRFSINDDPKRKLKFTLQMIKTPTSWVGVNTGLANDIVWEAWEKRHYFKAYKLAKREVKVKEGTRFDLVLWKKDCGVNPNKKISLEEFDKNLFHFVEVKNVTMADGQTALFPDAVTTRGQKHLRDLIDFVKQGHTSEIVFVVQRTDCDRFSPADQIDPEYGRLLRLAKGEGVKITAFACSLDKEQISLNTTKPLKVTL